MPFLFFYLLYALAFVVILSVLLKRKVSFWIPPSVIAVGLVGGTIANAVAQPYNSVVLAVSLVLGFSIAWLASRRDRDRI
jgi:hypothetical protein